MVKFPKNPSKKEQRIGYFVTLKDGNMCHDKFSCISVFLQGFTCNKLALSSQYRSVESCEMKEERKRWPKTRKKGETARA